MDVQAVSTALAATLSPLNLNVYDYGPAAPVAPAAYFAPETISYHATFEGAPDATWIVRFLIGSGSDQGGQALLNRLIDDTGVGSAVALLEADNTLGGAVDSLYVTSIRNYGVVAFADGASRFFSAELVIDIYA